MRGIVFGRAGRSEAVVDRPVDVVRTNCFDFVRLSASLLVLYSHQYPLTGRDEPVWFGRGVGTVAVFIFFAVSGYLVTQSFERAPNLFGFVRNRAVRIWPGIAVVTLLVIFALGPATTTKPLGEYFSDRETVDYLRQLYFAPYWTLPGVFDSNPYPRTINGSLWTIPVELAWYGILAVLGMSGLLRRQVPMFVATCALFVISVRQHHGGATPIFAPPLIEFGTCFLYGSFIATIRETFLRRQGAVLAASALVALALILTAHDYAALFVLVPPAAIALGESRTPVLRRFGRFGDFSFGIYIYAFAVQQSLVFSTGNRLPFGAGLAATLLVTLILAALSWKLVEHPALRWKARVRRRVPTSDRESP